MIFYLLKSALSLLVFIGFYFAFLEKEKAFVFNRFYLLLALVFSFTVPLMTVSYAIDWTVLFNDSRAAQLPDQVLPEVVAPKEFLSWQLFFVLVYVIGVIFKGATFLNGLRKIFSQKKAGERAWYKGYHLILVKEYVPVHSFWNDIFISKTTFQKHRIPEEVLAHEVNHIRQKHSFDVVLVELLSVIFWFNPVLIFYRRAIKLNHEYLADKKVISYFPDTLAYKKQLLNHAVLHKKGALVSTFNNSFTKKRLDMMSKKKSPVSIVFKQLLVLPLTALLFFAVCDTVAAQSNPTAPKKEKQAKPAKAEKPAKTAKPAKVYPAPVAVPAPPNPPAPPSSPKAAPVTPKAPPAPPAPAAAPAAPVPPVPPSPRTHPVFKEKKEIKSKQKSKVSKNKGI
jgi:hypothetical protein